MSIQSRNKETKLVTIFFDLEGTWGSGFPSNLVLERALNVITKTLKRFEIRAVFNTCGKVMEERPDLVWKLYSDGHEIASHGWAHENFLTLSIQQLDKVLSKTEMTFEDLTGDKILGIRPPFLLSKANCDSAVSQPIRAILKQISNRGYRWISYRKIVFMEEWMTFLRSNQATARLTGLRRKLLSMKVRLSERSFQRTPKSRRRLLDIPLTSSMDCDILGMLLPTNSTSKEEMDTLLTSLELQFKRSGTHFNLNFHPWLLGSSNRPVVLQRIVEFINRTSECEWILASDIVRQVHT